MIARHILAETRKQFRAILTPDQLRQLERIAPMKEAPWTRENVEYFFLGSNPRPEGEQWLRVDR